MAHSEHRFGTLPRDAREWISSSSEASFAERMPGRQFRTLPRRVRNAKLQRESTVTEPYETTLKRSMSEGPKSRLNPLKGRRGGKEEALYATRSQSTLTIPRRIDSKGNSDHVQVYPPTSRSLFSNVSDP